MPPLTKITDCYLFGATTPSEPIVAYCKLDHKEHIPMEAYFNIEILR